MAIVTNRKGNEMKLLDDYFELQAKIFEHFDCGGRLRTVPLERLVRR